MSIKLKHFVFFVITLVIIIGPVEAQLKTIYKFKKVMIPLDMEYEDTVIKKGPYDIEYLKNQAAGFYIMRILKGRKKLCTLTGEEMYYDSMGGRQITDPTIPDEPTMKMKKNAEEQQIHFIFETGKTSSLYPFVKLRFKIGYVEE